MKKRDEQMQLWMEEKKKELSGITDEDERIRYFKKVVLRQMKKRERQEKRVWLEHRDDFDMSLLDRSFDGDEYAVIPKGITAACIGKDFLDIIYSQNYTDIHQLVTDSGTSYAIKQRTERQKELLFYIDLHRLDGSVIARAEDVDTRNVTSVHRRAIDDIRTQLLPCILLKFKLEHDLNWRAVTRERFIYTIRMERKFCAENGKKYCKYWIEPYFKGINFNLQHIIEHYIEETARIVAKTGSKKKSKIKN